MHNLMHKRGVHMHDQPGPEGLVAKLKVTAKV